MTLDRSNFDLFLTLELNPVGLTVGEYCIIFLPILVSPAITKLKAVSPQVLRLIQTWLEKFGVDYCGRYLPYLLHT